MSWWEWFNTGAGPASIVGLIVTIGSVIQGMVGQTWPGPPLPPWGVQPTRLHLP